MSSQQLLTFPPTFILSNMSSETANAPGVCLSFSRCDCFANFDLDNAAFTPVLRRGQWVKDTAKMTALVLRAEADSDGEQRITRPRSLMHRNVKSVALKTSNKFDGLEVEESTDPDDSDYDSDMPSLHEISDDEDDDDNEDDKQDWEDIVEISNKEVRLKVICDISH